MKYHMYLTAMIKSYCKKLKNKKNKQIFKGIKKEKKETDVLQHK